MKKPSVVTSLRPWISLLRAAFSAAALLAASGASASPLQEKIQKELDASPFLAAQQLKMHVVNERQGNVTLELTEGPKKLRDLFRRGYEINSSALAETHLEPEVIPALRSIKRSLGVIKKLEGVKEISLTGSLSSAVASATGSETPRPNQCSLMEQIQKELDSSPFLAAQQLKMHVVNERQGNVTLELTEGPKKLRDLFRRGYEINSSALAETHLEPEVIPALRSIKRTVTALKDLKGVSEISLTGACSSTVSPEETSSEQPVPKEENSVLEESIQKELDASPYLAAQQLKMHVLSEKQGSVTLELTNGPQKLRDLFRRGYEINSSALAETNLDPEVVQALRSVKRTLNVIKGMDGVKELSLTGALSPTVTPAEIHSDNASLQGVSTPLMEQIQEKLDSSPFLAGQPVKMRVTNERVGVVSLEVSEGPKKLRDMLRKGYDINGDGLREMKLTQEIVQALRCVKRTVTIIKGMKGVKEISLTGAINTVKDRAENFYDEANQKISQNRSQDDAEILQLLTKSAELGFLRAQVDLAKVYLHGVDLQPDEERATFWLRKAAEQGDAPSQFQLAARYKQGQGTSKNYDEAIAWYRKAAGQDLNPDIRTRSQLALASILATCPMEPLRDGTAALEYAKSGIAAAPNGIAMETLASAYARCGQFDEAVEQEKKWIKQLTEATFLAAEEKKNLLSQANDRLRLYLEHQPYTAPE
ncbi:MAG: tetratricopeptide repeat protein [Verrucomicrobiota bacterium]